MDNSRKRGKENAVFSSRTVSLLVESIENAVRVKAAQLKECPELKALKAKCCDDNVCTAYSACQGITYLVEKKILNGSQTVSSLISLLSSVTHYPPLVISIGKILLINIKEEVDANGKYDCQYNFSDRSHPFVIILKHDPVKSWNSIYSYIQYLFHSNDNISFDNKINLLRPFFQYVFCDPSSMSSLYKNELFSLLLEQQERVEVKKLILQGLAWQQMDMNYCWLIYKICHSLLNSLDKENEVVIAALTPYLAAVIKWLILNAQNPVLWIDLLSESLKIDSSGASAVLYILSDVLLETPALFVNKLVDLCKTIIFSLPINKYIAQKFAAASLIWMVNPSSLAQPLFHTLETIFRFLHIKLKSNDWFQSKQTLSDNPYFDIIKNSRSEVEMGVEMTELTDNWKNEVSVGNWLQSLCASKNLVTDISLQNFISGIYLYENNDEILRLTSEILLSLSNKDSELSFNYLCLTFFKLTREVEPKRQLKYLESLAKIANAKENVPLIIGILETLKNDNTETMLPVVIDLYLKLWKVDNRIYSYIHKTLFNSGENSWEIDVMKTIALREICKSSPETYGKSLVSKLSEVLNHCDNYSSGIPSAIAIEAVIELCKASVTDITGAWKALKPKLSRDKRREVVISLCKLFSEVPALKSSGAERDALMSDIVPRLWGYAFSNDLKIVRAALKALSKFSGESYGPKLLPDVLKGDLEVPKQYCKTATDVSREELLEELEYVPGECWVEVIQRIDSRAVRDAGDMISCLIQEELHTLPRRFFCHPEEVPEPVNYTHLPHSSICRALVFHIKNYLASHGKAVPESVLESLRILSCDYSKCLPVLDWSFLEGFFNFGGDCKKYSVTILVKQATVTKAGRKVLENYMMNNVDKLEDVNDFTYLFSALPYVCNSLSANTLRRFLEKTIKLSCTYSLKNSGTDHFENFLKNAKIALDSKIVPDPRKALLVSQIQNILSHIPPDHPVMMAYAEFVAGLPVKTVESISSLSSSTKLTSEKIRRSVCIRKVAALNPECSNPLVWFNDCIDAVLNSPEEHRFIIGSILDVLRQSRGVNHSTWLTELMWRIQASITSVTTPDSVQVTLFLLDIFSIASVTLSGYDYFLSSSQQESLTKSSLRFLPISLHKLLGLKDYTNLSPKVIEWIHGLSKWKNLPQEYVETLQQSILILRSNKFCSEKNKWFDLFYQL